MTLGRFTVRCVLRFDNPLFPKYLIFRGEKLIGVQFSHPNLSDCQWHERRHGQYARPDESKQDPSWQLKICRPKKRGRKPDAFEKAAMERMFK